MKNTSILNTIGNIICWPFRTIWRFLCYITKLLKRLDWHLLFNLILLISIIVLFIVLIGRFVKCKAETNQEQLVTNTQNTIAPDDQVVVTTQRAPVRIHATRTAVLPIRIDKQTNKMQHKPIQVVEIVDIVTKVEMPVRYENVTYGPVFIDSKATGRLLHHNDKIDGDLYIQNMHSYTLPCDVVIKGNLFLRDIHMLHFCGDFTVTGNIYVTPTSSFGPIPRTARIGGQIIL